MKKQETRVARASDNAKVEVAAVTTRNQDDNEVVGGGSLSCQKMKRDNNKPLQGARRIGGTIEERD